MNLIYDELEALIINKQETNGGKWITAMTVGNNEMMGMGRRYVMQGKQDDDYAVMIIKKYSSKPSPFTSMLNVEIRGR